MSKYVIIVTYVPGEYAEQVRQALAKVGAGQIGEYSACSFSSQGEGRFQPGLNANPLIGTPGQAQVVEEIRIEAICPRQKAKAAVNALIEAHPYEEPAWHCYEALLMEDLI